VEREGGAAMMLRKRLRFFGRLLLAILTLLWIVSVFAASAAAGQARYRPAKIEIKSHCDSDYNDL
jgi:hypothetical protein